MASRLCAHYMRGKIVEGKNAFCDELFFFFLVGVVLRGGGQANFVCWRDFRHFIMDNNIYQNYKISIALLCL